MLRTHPVLLRAELQKKLDQQQSGFEQGVVARLARGLISAQANPNKLALPGETQNQKPVAMDEIRRGRVN